MIAAGANISSVIHFPVNHGKKRSYYIAILWHYANIPYSTVTDFAKLRG